MPATNPGTTGLVAWWALGEAGGDRADSHIGGYTLTDVNTVGSAAGIVGNAAAFTQADDDALTSANAAIVGVPVSASSWTVVLWIYPTTDSALREPVSTYDATGKGLWCRRRGLTDFGSSVVAWDLITDAGADTRVEGGANTPINTWSMIALRFDTAIDKAYAYTNGTATAGVDFAGTMTARALFALGRRAGSTIGYTFPGRVDEASLWSACLSTDNLDWLYNAGAGRAYAELAAAAGLPVIAWEHARIFGP